MGACGPAGKWRPGWRANSGSPRSCPNAAGRRSRRSTGRCRSRARAILPRPRPRSARRLKKAGAGRRRGAGPAPGHAGRGLGHGRAPHWPEADPAPGLGPQRSAADRPRPPPLQVALRHRLRPANLRRDLLVRVERGVQAVLRRAPGVVCPRGRGGTRAHDRARARQRRLAHRAEPGRARWDPARLLAPLLPRASARRAPVACPRRAARKPVLRDPRRSRTRRRRALPRSRWRSAQPRYKLPLVAQADQADQAELISRIPYDASGHVVDGRDAFLAWCVARTSGDPVAVFDLFAKHADLTRPKRDGRDPWTRRDAEVKAKTFERKQRRGALPNRKAKGRPANGDWAGTPWFASD